MVAMVNGTVDYKNNLVQLSERIHFVAQAMRSLSADQANYSQKVADLRTELKLIASCVREMEPNSQRDKALKPRPG